MNLSQLEILAAVAETGSFTDAADRVGLTRSAVSHALANLETELGVTLLERERGGVLPTTVGNCVLRNVYDILASVESIQQEAAMARGLAAGKLRIGIVSSIAVSVWGAVLRKFRQEYPGIEQVTFEGSGHEVEDWIMNGTVDVGFVLRGVEGIESAMIGEDEVKIVVPVDSPLRRQKSVTLDRITREGFIMPKIACDFYSANWHGAKELHWQKRYEASEVRTVLAMVREGLGVTMLPAMLLPAQLDGVHLLSLDPAMRFKFGVGMKSGRNASPAAKIFMMSARTWAKANGFEQSDDTAIPLVPAIAS